jgi:5-methylcytosine-specific restriction endonuclease McrA
MTYKEWLEAEAKVRWEKYNYEFRKKDIQTALARQRGRCAYCGCDLLAVEPFWPVGAGPAPHRYHADHIVPYSKGGRSTLDNLAITCPLCNLRKRDKPPEGWVATFRRAVL